jgi:hypothetical protein
LKEAEARKCLIDKVKTELGLLKELMAGLVGENKSIIN